MEKVISCLLALDIFSIPISSAVAWISVIDFVLKSGKLRTSSPSSSDFDITSSEVNVAALSWKSFLCLGPLFLLCLPLFGIFTYFG